MADRITQIVFLPLMAYAACGLVVSLAVHLLSLVGLRVGGNALFFGLHAGIVPLWLAVVLIATKLTGGTMGTGVSVTQHGKGVVRSHFSRPDFRAAARQGQ